MWHSKFFVDGDVRIKEIFEEFDPLNTGNIDYITWSMMLAPSVRFKVFMSLELSDRTLTE